MQLLWTTKWEMISVLSAIMIHEAESDHQKGIYNLPVFIWFQKYQKLAQIARFCLRFADTTCLALAYPLSLPAIYVQETLKQELESNFNIAGPASMFCNEDNQSVSIALELYRKYMGEVKIDEAHSQHITKVYHCCSHTFRDCLFHTGIYNLTC